MPMKSLDELFHYGQSPYFAMYTAGLAGYEADEVVAFCHMNNIAVRPKDMANFERGRFNSQARPLSRLNPKGMGRKMVSSRVDPSIKAEMEARERMANIGFDDFPRLPVGWTGTDHRFFPCTSDNKPMMKWGYSDGYVPQLMTMADARSLSKFKGGPGWVGQNMLYQPFIVIDIDGEGHGERDEQVIEWGNGYSSKTMTLCDPAKPGSFHLYFGTDRLVPVRHYPWAKIDLMGNAVNAAVYFKNKKSNGRPMAMLTKEVWDDLMGYVNRRKEQSQCL